MKKKLLTLIALTVLVFNTNCVFAKNNEMIIEHNNGFEDGNFKNVLAVRGSSAVINQSLYQGANVTLEKEEKAGNFLRLDSSKSGVPTFIYQFQKAMKGKVVIEADIRMDNLTATRNLFEIINEKQQPVVRLDGYHYYYNLGYENVTLEINEIPINNEWHHYMAVIDTDNDTFMLYINGRPVMASPVGVYRGNSAKNGVWGFRTSITYKNMVNFREATTDVDNIRVYELKNGEYTDLKSKEYDFDFEYLTVDGAYKGITVGEFLKNIETDGEIKVFDSKMRERKEDEYISLKDLLVVTKGKMRSFYSIRLSENDYDVILRANSPEIFLSSVRSQYFDDDSEIKSFMKDGSLYVPVRSLEKIFDAKVLYNGDENTVKVKKDSFNINAYTDYKNINSNGRLYVDIKEYASLFGYNCFSDGELFVVDKNETEFKSEKQIQYIKNTFTFYDDSDKAIIKDFSDINDAVKKAGEMWEKGFSGDIVIDLSDKNYFVSESIKIDGEKLNNKNNRLILRGDKEKHAKISGGIKLKEEKFKKVTDINLKKRFSQAAADKILMYDLSEEGIKDTGIITSQGHTFEIKPSQLQLYSDNKTQTLARFPNEGYLYSGVVFNKGYGWSDSGVGDNEFEYIEDRISSWNNSDDIWAFGYWNDEYSPGNARIRKIDRTKKSLTLDGIIRAGISKTQRPYYIYNVLEELDSPGEYYVDTKTKVLYYYPSEDFNKKPLYVSYTNDILLTLYKCKNVVIENVDFTYTRDMGAKAFFGENILFNKCNFIGMGTYGIIFRECSNSGAYACYFYETGAHSVMLEGGDTVTLSKGNNFVISSKFEETGFRRKTYSASILLRGMENYAYKNRIQNNYHMGIYVFGSFHVMKNNSFYNICYESGDAGGIYMYARWSTSVTTVEGNYYEHMRGTPEVYAPSNTAIYYDNSTSFTNTYGNVFYDVMNGVFSNCGRENKITGNVFSDIINNAGSLAQNTQLAIYETIHTIPWKGKIWKRENPRLYEMQFNYNPTKATGTFAANNILDNTPEFTNADPTVIKTYDNVAYKEGKDAFMDKKNKDFRLREPSAFKNTYHKGAVELKNIGPSKDMKAYTEKELSRLYISTDISSSGEANIFAPLNEKFSVHINAKSKDDDYIDLSAAHILYESSDDNIVSISENGTVNPRKEGKATICATVTLNGITKKIELIIYTDKFLYDTDSTLNKKDIHLMLDSKPIDIQNKCEIIKGVLFVPFEEVLNAIGYESKKTDNRYLFEYSGQKLEMTPGSKAIVFNGKAFEAESEAYEKDGVLFAPFTICDNINLISIYKESDGVGEIYRLNNASGEGKAVIPENAKVVDLSDLLKNDAEGWTNDKTALYRREGDEVRFGENTQSSKLGVFSYDKEKFGINTMFKFNYMLNTNAYASIMIGSEEAYCVPWRVSDVDSYFIVIKNDVIEVQKRINNSQCYIIDSVENKYISFDKWHEMSVGTFESENGKVRIIINSDGKNIVDVYDNINYSLSGKTRNIMENPLSDIRNDGYISFGIFTTDSSPKCYVGLK